MGLNKEIEILRNGGSVVYPTDTVYGIAVDATNTEAVKNLYKIKERTGQPTHVVVSNLGMAKEYAVFSKTAEKFFNKFFPGPITLILPLKKDIPDSFKILSANTKTIGIRIPNNKTTMDIVEKLERPITTPSANPKGGVAPLTIKESMVQFEDKKHKPDFYLDGGELKKNNPSTMVKIVEDVVVIIREGPITKEEIINYLNEEGRKNI